MPAGGGGSAVRTQTGPRPQKSLEHGLDPYDFVIAKNLGRRDLTKDQRAAAGAALATLKRGNLSKSAGSADYLNKTEAKVAADLGVSVRAVQQAKHVEREDHEAFEEVKAGTKTLASAR